MPLAYADTVDKYAKLNNLDPELVHKVIDAESGGNPMAVSPKGAKGLMQLMPDTAKEMGVKDPHDPEQNIMGGTKYLAKQFKQFGGNARLALAAYNAGPERAMNPSAETKAYVNKIMGKNGDGDLGQNYSASKDKSQEDELTDWLSTTSAPAVPVSKKTQETKPSGKSMKPEAEEGTLSSVLKPLWEATKATPETAASIATGMAAWPVSKAGFFMTVPFWGGEKAQAFEDYLQQHYSYQPEKYEGERSNTDRALKLMKPYMDKNLNFLQRLQNPDAYPKIENPDGSYSTHLMANSDNFVYPTIIQDPKTKKLKKLGDKEAYDYAMKTGEYIKTPTPEDAEWLANNNYKRPFGIPIEGQDAKLNPAYSAAQLAGKISSIPFYPSKWLGELAEKITGNPDAKYVVTNIGDVLTAILIPKIAGKAKGAIGDRFSALKEAPRKAWGEDEGTEPATEPTPTSEPPVKEPLTKAQQLERSYKKAPGDFTADMERVNQRAHDELQAAYNQIPKEEWDKFWKDGKPKNIEDVAKLVDEHAKRLSQDKAESPKKDETDSELVKRKQTQSDLEKLPAYYQDAIKRESESVKQRAENLKDIADEAKKANADIQIIPGTLKPRATGEATLRPAIKTEGEVKIGKPGDIHPDVIRDNKIGPDTEQERGFADEQGNFLNRQQAKNHLKNYDPDLYAKWKEVTGDDKKPLHSEDLNEAVSRTKLRSVGDIARDMLTVLDSERLLHEERGSLEDKPLKPEQQAAYNRLKADFGTIVKNAKKAGKSMENYLTDLGFDPETVKYLALKTQEGATKQEQPASASPDLRINLARIANTDSVKELIAQTNLEQQASGKIGETTRGVRPHTTTIAASKAVKMTVEDILNRKPGEVWNAEQQQAVRDIDNSLATKVKDLKDRVKAGDEKAANDLPSALALFGEVHSQNVGVGAEIARSLESRKILSSSTRQPFNLDNLADLAQKVKDSAGDPKVLADRIDLLETPEQLGKFASQWMNTLKMGKDMFLYCWVNGLLSSLKLPFKIIGSNLAYWGLKSTMETAAYGIGKGKEALGFGKGQDFYEEGARLDFAFHGFSEALDVAKKTWKEDRGKFGKGPAPEVDRNPFAMKNLGTSGAWGKALEFMGNVIGAPGRACMSVHQFQAALHFRGEAGVLAMKEATAEGLTDKPFADRVDHIMGNLDQFPSIMDKAKEYGEYHSFLNDLGKMGTSFQAFTNSHWFAKMTVPFLKIPLNIFKRGLEYAPGLNLMLGEYREDIMAGGERANRAMAKAAVGAMGVYAFHYLTQNGLMTGKGPEDPKLNKIWRDNHQPDSVKIGDQWISHKPLGPISLLMSTASDMTFLVDEHNLDNFYQGSAALALSFSRAFLQESYMEGVSNLFDAIKSAEKLPQKGEKWMEEMASSMIPTIARQINQEYFDPKVREVNSVLDALKADWFGASKTLMPIRGFFGQPLVHYQGSMSRLFDPFTAKPYKPDAVTKEILMNSVDLDMPKGVEGRAMPSENPLQANEPRATWGIKLDPQQYDDLVKFSRLEKHDNDMNLKEALKDLIDSDYYKDQTDGPDGGKTVLIKSMVQQYDAEGQQMLFEKYPDLIDKMQAQQENKINALTPGAK